MELEARPITWRRSLPERLSRLIEDKYAVQRGFPLRVADDTPEVVGWLRTLSQVGVAGSDMLLDLAFAPGGVEVAVPE